MSSMRAVLPTWQPNEIIPSPVSALRFSGIHLGSRALCLPQRNLQKSTPKIQKSAEISEAEIFK